MGWGSNYPGLDARLDFFKKKVKDTLTYCLDKKQLMKDEVNFFRSVDRSNFKESKPFFRGIRFFKTSNERF